ncbi:retrotransposon ORF1 [Tanacetum coccineum]|uniref:Retrotransposon ORF1 n=1 Tax=Tanacetum coccineum TaxID=301880 RepID=A0ABQ4XXM8_9ASTR
MLRINLRKAESNEEIFTSVAWIRAFNIKEPIYAELCHEFYSTYEFNEVCANDELQRKKIIKFRVGGRAHNLTLLEFAHRLGLYHADELEEDGFDVSYASTIKNSILRVEPNFEGDSQKDHLWLVSKDYWMKRKRDGTQKESQICCRQLITKIDRTDVVLRSLSALIYCRDLDTTTLRELIDSKGRLIPRDPQPGVPRVGIPRPSRVSMQDLYDRIGSMEIRQEAIERMEYGSHIIETGQPNPKKDFQENSNDEVDERSSEEYLRDLDIDYQERALLVNSKRFIKRRNNFSSQKTNENIECYKCGNKGQFARDCFSKTSEPSYKSSVNNYSSVSKGFQPKFTSKRIQSSSNSNSQANLNFQKDYKAEYKKMKTKLALLEASPSSSRNPKTFQPKNKGLVTKTFNWDEEEVSDEE